MKHVLHLIAADIRQHRALIALWLVVVIASTVVHGLHPILAGDAAVRSALGLLSWVLWILMQIVRIVLIVRVVQTHSLIGSDAFWLTRPIPPRTLLLAKVVLLVCCIVGAQVIAEASLMALHDVPLMTLVGVAADTALGLMALLAILMAAASVTPSFSRFMLLGVGTLASLALYVAVNVVVDSARPGIAPPGLLLKPETTDATGFVVLLILVAVAFAAILLVQYGTRSRLRSSLVGVAAVVAALYATEVWPWRLLQARTELPTWAGPGSAFRITVDQAAVSDGSIVGEAGWRRFVGPLQAIGLENSWSAAAGLLGATLQLDNGTVLRSAPDVYPRSLSLASGGSETYPPEDVIGRLLGVRGLAEAPHAPPTGPLLVLREQDVRVQEPARGSYRGRFHVQLTHHEVEATLPLTSGAHGGRPPHQVAIDRVGFAFGNVEVRLRESDASSSFDRRPRPERRFFLRNARLSEAVEGRPNDVDRFPGFFGVTISPNRNRFHTANIGLTFGSGLVHGEYREGAPLADASWLRNAELVVIESTQERAVERTIEIAQFPLTR